MVKQIRIPTGNALWDHTFEKIRKDGVRHAQNMRDKAKNAKKVDFPTGTNNFRKSSELTPFINSGSCRYGRTGLHRRCQHQCIRSRLWSGAEQQLRQQQLHQQHQWKQHRQQHQLCGSQSYIATTTNS